MAMNLDPEIIAKLNCLTSHQHQELVSRALDVILRMSSEELDRLDWKILTASLEDLERGFTTFAPYQRNRKIAILALQDLNRMLLNMLLLRSFLVG